MHLRLGYSPCPNDTFIFDAMVHGKVDTEGLIFDLVIEDVEALNKRAFAGDIEVTKLSYHAFAHLTHSYRLLDAGSALGNNCGPLLIARQVLTEEEINSAGIAIPGHMTTANFLLSLAYPAAKNRSEVLFSAIEDALLARQFDAGLIIHENRFTYAEKGLVKLRDLGEFWEQSTGLPIPLGGIVVNRKLPEEIQQKINRTMRRSVEFAFANPDSVMPYVREHAQAMDDAVMKAHIELYVNNYTVNLGREGRKAVGEMFRIASENGSIPAYADDFFIN